jgi:hypothetical protein
MDAVTLDGAIRHNVNQVRRYIDLFDHEVHRKKPSLAMLRHYMESVDAHMRMASNAALSSEALCADQEGGRP